ncbi:MAG: F0F1 ATP synthase subunit B [Verrucomicrobia bacterium]|jgi:F-type H+-transporting ATPase subunit b|nr:F0F1 ATP synthase subunit B [Verrucomicrobiota bacterium]
MGMRLLSKRTHSAALLTLNGWDTMGHFDPGLFFWSLATFAGLMLLLSRFAFKPLRELLAEREKRMQQTIEEAKQARDEAQQLVNAHRAELATAREEARGIVDAGNRMVAEQQREAEIKAQEHADLLIDRARGEIERETQKGLEDLKGTLATLSVRIARQVIREDLNEARHAELADQFIDRLKKNRNAQHSRND